MPRSLPRSFAVWSSFAFAVSTTALSTGGCSDDGTTTGPGPTAGGGGDGGAAAARCILDEDCQKVLPTTTPADCAEGRCDAGRCRFISRDRDDDGQRAKSCVSTKAGISIEVGKDCDDTKKAVYDGAWDGPKADGKADSCDGIDNDCDGKVDDGEALDGATCKCSPGENLDCDLDSAGKKIDWPKVDKEGTPTGLCKRGTQTCLPNGKYGPCTGAILPVSEICDGKDNDCDGDVDEEIVNKPLWFYDFDGDGHASESVEAVAACANPGATKCPDGKPPCTAKWTKSPEGTGDCDDKDDEVHPGAWDGPAQRVIPSGIVPPGLQASIVDCADSVCLTSPNLYIACDSPAVSPSKGACLTGGECNPVSGAGCPADQNCLLGGGTPYCVPSTKGALCAACKNSGECAAGSYCDSGVCTKWCCDDGDCGTNAICYVDPGSFGLGLCVSKKAEKIFAAAPPLGTHVSINFDLGTGSIAPNAPNDAAVRWFGKIQSETGGEHTFFVDADNGVRLYVNGKLLIDDWTRDGAVAHTAKATLAKGVPTTFQVDWFDSAFNGIIKVHWEKLPEMPRQVLTLMMPAPAEPRPNRCADGIGNAKPKDYDCNGKDHDSLVTTAALGSVLRLGCDAKCDPLDPSATAAGLTRACGMLPANVIGSDGVPMGACRGGAQTCQPNGQWGDCAGLVPPAAAEICSNYTDDNCNGKSDDDDGCVCKPNEPVLCNKDACNEGTVTCSATGKVDCPAPHPKNAGQCLSVNDPNLSTTEKGKFGGACQLLGNYICKDGVSVCSATPGKPDEDFHDTPSKGHNVPWDWNCDDDIAYAITNQAGVKQEIALTEVPEASCKGNPIAVQTALYVQAFKYCSAITNQGTCSQAATIFYCGAVGGNLQNASVPCGKTTGYARCEWDAAQGCIAPASLQGGAPQAKVLCK